MCGVIFLDFDGPIFPEKIHMYPQNNGEWAKEKCAELNLHPYVKYWYADPFAIAILNKLKEMFDCQLVISSSWADERLHDKSQIESVLKANGLNYTLHDDWRTPRNQKERKDQIEEWLGNHPEIKENYFIFDDTKSAPELFFEKTYLTSSLKQRNVYLAHEKDGFNYDQFEDMMFYMGLFNEKTKKHKM